jgi:hypothetical protein
MLANDGFLVAESAGPTYAESVGRVLEPSWVTRLAAQVRGGALDRALIGGADPAASRQLATRVARLTSTRKRMATAADLERLLRVAQSPASRWGVLPRRGPVLAAGDELRALVALLRGSTPLSARGIAMLGQLLADGTGPLYAGQDDLGRRLGEVRRAMEGGDDR